MAFTYAGHAQDRSLLERAMTVSSDEMRTLHDTLRQDNLRFVRDWPDDELAVTDTAEVDGTDPRSLRQELPEALDGVQRVTTIVRAMKSLARSVVVDGHHGSITLASQPLAGTTVRIRLPVRDGCTTARPH